MSMNLYLSATLTGKTKTGKPVVQTEYIDLWQTPTSITYKIMEMDDKLQGYIDYIESIDAPYIQNVYEKDDIFCEGKVIDTFTIYPGKQHINEVKEAIKYFTENEYVLEWYYM